MNHEPRTMNKTLCLALLCFFLYIGSAMAEVPSLIRYQGQAMDSNQVPLEGPYTLIFRLYDAATAGTKLWEETQSNVQLAGGHFSVLLGQVTPLNAMGWDQPCWLSVQVNAEPELAPRQQITSVPLALRARMAEQLTVPVTTSTITDDANKLVPTGAIILWTGTSCPSGYTRVSAMDGKFLVSGTTYNPTAGGSNTHTHSPGSYTGPSHTHAVPYNGWSSNGSSADMSILSMGKSGEAFARPTSNNTSGVDGARPITGISGSGDSRPEFATILLCQKN